jgi:hypothetical protein
MANGPILAFSFVADGEDVAFLSMDPSSFYALLL